jgi:hypothetical protein
MSLAPLTRLGRVAAVVLLAALLAGCSLVSAYLEIRGIVRDAGVAPRGIDVSTSNGVTTLTVGYRTVATDEAAAVVESRRVAEALWDRAPVGFDVLRLEPSGPGSLAPITVDAADLEDEFGPRPEGAGGDLTGGLLRDLAVAAAVGLVVLIGIVVLIVLLVRRSRRRRHQRAQPWPGQPGPGPWPPSPPPPPRPPAPPGAGPPTP